MMSRTLARRGGYFLGRYFLRKSRPVIGNGGKCREIQSPNGTKFYSVDVSNNIVHSPMGEIKVPELLFHELIFENWSLWERKTAVECVLTGKKYTFKNIMNYSKSLAAAFRNKLNLSKGDIIAIILPNCVDYPVVLLAASQCGVVPTVVNPSYTVDEIVQQLQQCNVKLIVTDTTNYSKCTIAVNRMNTSFSILVSQGHPDSEIPSGGIDLHELYDPSISGRLTPPNITPDDILIVPHSSGTSGRPKGVLLTHRNAVSNLCQLSHPETMIITPTTRFRRDSVFVILPMFHIFGLMICTFYSLKEGCRLLILPSFSKRGFLANLYKKKMHIVYVVPPILLLLAHPAVARKYLRHIKYLVNGASPLPVSHAYRILEKAEHLKIVQGYGMTEASPVITHTHSLRTQKLESIGIPIASTKIKVTNLETGLPAPKGEHGEICVWGPQVMKGYMNNPEDTALAFDSEGWLRTGDVGYYDGDGDFYIIDRIKDLIKVKGFQVAPRELEEIILTHPKINDVAVVSVPDPVYGEVPRAFVILKKDESMSEDEVKDFLKSKVVHYKQLRGGVRFVEELPTNKVGKVLRKELKNLP